MIWFYLFTAIIVGLDQLTKWMIVKQLDLYERITVVENFFHITSFRNKGAAWGILQDKQIFFYLITIIVIIGLLFYQYKYAKESIALSISMGLIMGGAIGNFIGRIFRKEVVDFLDFNIFGYDFPIFNIADSALCIGVILFFILTLMEEKQKGKK